MPSDASVVWETPTDLASMSTFFLITKSYQLAQLGTFVILPWQYFSMIKFWGLTCQSYTWAMRCAVVEVLRINTDYLGIFTVHPNLEHRHFWPVSPTSQQRSSGRTYSPPAFLVTHATLHQQPSVNPPHSVLLRILTQKNGRASVCIATL